MRWKCFKIFRSIWIMGNGEAQTPHFRWVFFTQDACAHRKKSLHESFSEAKTDTHLTAAKKHSLAHFYCHWPWFKHRHTNAIHTFYKSWSRQFFSFFFLLSYADCGIVLYARQCGNFSRILSQHRTGGKLAQSSHAYLSSVHISTFSPLDSLAMLWERHLFLFCFWLTV